MHGICGKHHTTGTVDEHSHLTCRRQMVTKNDCSHSERYPSFAISKTIPTETGSYVNQIVIALYYRWI